MVPTGLPDCGGQTRPQTHGQGACRRDFKRVLVTHGPLRHEQGPSFMNCRRSAHRRDLRQYRVLPRQRFDGSFEMLSPTRPAVMPQDRVAHLVTQRRPPIGAAAQIPHRGLVFCNGDWALQDVVKCNSIGSVWRRSFGGRETDRDSLEAGFQQRRSGAERKRFDIEVRRVLYLKQLRMRHGAERPDPVSHPGGRVFPTLVAVKTNRQHYRFRHRFDNFFPDFEEIQAVNGQVFERRAHGENHDRVRRNTEGLPGLALELGL